MRLRHPWFGLALLAALPWLTGCPLAVPRAPKPAASTAAPSAAAASGIIPNPRVNPNFSIDSQLPDPFIYRDTVQHMADNPVSIRVNDLFQSVVTGYTRFKFPQTANPGSAASDSPDIIIWLTYLNFDARWNISQVFMVDSVVEMKVDVKRAGKINERVLRATGQGHGSDAFQDAAKAAIRNGVPVLDQYLSSLNL